MARRAALEAPTTVVSCVPQDAGKQGAPRLRIGQQQWFSFVKNLKAPKAGTLFFAFYCSARLPWKSCGCERGRSKLYRNCCRQFFKSKLLLRSSKAILGYLVVGLKEREAAWPVSRIE